MKQIAWIFLALLASSSGSKSAKPAGGDTSAAGGEGEPCTREVALVCPDGQIDACEKALAEDETPDAGATGTMMAVEEGRMGKRSRAGAHRCVAK